MEIEYDNPTDCKSNPNDEADPLCIKDEDNSPLNCEWKEWGECSASCGEGIQVQKHFKKIEVIKKLI